MILLLSAVAAVLAAGLLLAVLLLAVLLLAVLLLAVVAVTVLAVPVPRWWIPEGIRHGGPPLIGPVWGKLATVPGVLCKALGGMAGLQGLGMLVAGRRCLALLRALQGLLAMVLLAGAVAAVMLGLGLGRRQGQVGQ